MSEAPELKVVGLALTRRVMEGVVLDGKILVTVISVKGKQAKLCFTDINGHVCKIDRREVFETKGKIVNTDKEKVAVVFAPGWVQLAGHATTDISMGATVFLEPSTGNVAASLPPRVNYKSMKEAT